MPLHTLVKLVRTKKRRGRGHAKRGGKSGRGMKGQKSRAGYSRKAGFEGGQTPLYMRLPKGRGSKQRFAPQAIKFQAVSVARLNHFADKSVVGPQTLAHAGLIDSATRSVKIIGDSPIKCALTVRVHRVTQKARGRIEEAGGRIEILNV